MLMLERETVAESVDANRSPNHYLTQVATYHLHSWMADQNLPPTTGPEAHPMGSCF